MTLLLFWILCRYYNGARYFRQSRTTSERYISLETLRERLEVTNQYKRFYDLKKYVIDSSINDINASTNLFVEWEVIKKGKVITGLVFKFKEKQAINSLPTDVLEEETL